MAYNKYLKLHVHKPINRKRNAMLYLIECFLCDLFRGVYAQCKVIVTVDIDSFINNGARKGHHFSLPTLPVTLVN